MREWMSKKGVSWSGTKQYGSNYNYEKTCLLRRLGESRRRPENV